MKSNVCPICDSKYDEGSNNEHSHTRHHIFCRQWYPDSTLVVSVCKKCHSEFNRDYQNMATRRWAKRECLIYWGIFCQRKGKNVNCIYPELLSYNLH